MNENVIDFDQIEKDDILDVRLRGADGTILTNVRVFNVVSSKDSIYVQALGAWVYKDDVEEIILKKRADSGFKEGLYVNAESIGAGFRLFQANVWRFDGRTWSNVNSTAPSQYPGDVYGRMWREQMAALSIEEAV